MTARIAKPMTRPAARVVANPKRVRIDVVRAQAAAETAARVEQDQTPGAEAA